MDFAETIVVYDVKVVRYINLNEYLKLYEYQRSRSLIDLGPNLSYIFKLLFLNRPVEAKFYVEPPWDEGTKAYSNDPGHMAKMAAMPIYDKKQLKIYFSGIERPMTLKLGVQHWAFVFSNDAPGLTLNYFMTVVPHAFVLEKVKTMDFSKTIVVYDIKL